VLVSGQVLEVFRQAKNFQTMLVSLLSLSLLIGLAAGKVGFDCTNPQHLGCSSDNTNHGCCKECIGAIQEDFTAIRQWETTFKAQNPTLTQAQVDQVERIDRLDWGHPDLKNCYFCAGKCWNNADDSIACQVTSTNPFGNKKKRDAAPAAKKRDVDGVEAMCGTDELNQITIILPSFGRRYHCDAMCVAQSSMPPTPNPTPTPAPPATTIPPTASPPTTGPTPTPAPTPRATTAPPTPIPPPTPSPSPAPPALPPVAGNVRFVDAAFDVPLPPNAPTGTVSGWDIGDVDVTVFNDQLVIAASFRNLLGDADGDGNASTTAPWLAQNGGVDQPRLGGSETVGVFVDYSGSAKRQVFIGWTSRSSAPQMLLLATATESTGSTPVLDDATVINYVVNGTLFSRSFLVTASIRELMALVIPTLGRLQIVSAPRVQIFAGSRDDDGIGDDVFPHNFLGLDISFGLATPMPTPVISCEARLTCSACIDAKLPGPSCVFCPESHNLTSVQNACRDGVVCSNRLRRVRTVYLGSSDRCPAAWNKVPSPPTTTFPVLTGAGTFVDEYLDVPLDRIGSVAPVTGWDIDRVNVTITNGQQLLVSADFHGLLGDADGDGDAGRTDYWLQALGGRDVPDLGQWEGVGVFFDLGGPKRGASALDGLYDVFVGFFNGTAGRVVNMSGTPDRPPYSTFEDGQNRIVVGSGGQKIAEGTTIALTGLEDFSLSFVLSASRAVVRVTGLDAFRQFLGFATTGNIAVRVFAGSESDSFSVGDDYVPSRGFLQIDPLGSITTITTATATTAELTTTTTPATTTATTTTTATATSSIAATTTLVVDATGNGNSIAVCWLAAFAAFACNLQLF
jgi:hypothetical protein